MRGRAGPVTEISLTGKKILPYEHSSSGDRDEPLLTQHSDQNRIAFVVYVFPL